MADLITTDRKIGQPNAPDISGAAKATGALGEIVQKAATTVGEYVHANNVLQANALSAGAETSFERSFVSFKNDPMLDESKLLNFQADIDGQTQAYLDQAPRGMRKELTAKLEATKNKYLTQALDATQKTVIKNQIRDATITTNQLINMRTEAIGRGDIEAAKEFTAQLDSQLASMYALGVSGKQIVNADNEAKSSGVYAFYASQLQRATTNEQRLAIGQEAMKLPKTDANNKAIGMLFKDINRLNKVYKEATDFTDITQNILGGNAHQNASAPSKKANAYLELAAQNLQNGMAQQPGKPVEAYQVLTPRSDLGTSANEDYGLAEDGETPRNFVEKRMAEDIQAPKQPTSLAALGEAQALSGLASATVFTNKITNALVAGNGNHAFEAYTVFNKVYEQNKGAFKLGDQAYDLYSYFKIGVESGVKDYDELIKEARDVVIKQAPLNVKRNNETYNSLTGGKDGSKWLKNSFKNATGIDPFTSNSSKAFSDYDALLRLKFLAMNGNMVYAERAAIDVFNATHGSDMFSNIVNGERQVVLFPATQTLGLSETAVNNQLIQRLYENSLTNESIRVPSDFEKIKNVGEFDLLYNPRPLSRPRLDGVAYSTEQLEIEVSTPEGFRKGKVFLKSNSFTEQNDTGEPVWEFWIQPKVGRPIPVPSNNSPISNTLLFNGRTKNQFVPRLAKKEEEEATIAARDKLLSEQGRAVWPRLSLTPVTNAIKRREMAKDPENIKKADELIRKGKE